MFMLVRAVGAKPTDSGLLPESTARAVSEANSSVPEDTVAGIYTTPTSRGVAVALVSNHSQQDCSQDWLEAFTNALESTGVQARISSTQRWSRDIDHLVVTERTYPAAFVAYRLDRYTPLEIPVRGWLVDHATTQLVAQAFEDRSTSLPDCDVRATTPYGEIMIPPSEIAAFLSAMATRVPRLKRIDNIQRDGRATHRVAFHDTGQCVSQTVAPDRDWRSLLDTLVDHLLIGPELADVGMIKNVSRVASSWSSLDLRSLHRTVRLPFDFERNRHLWDEYVIDAGGINLLTSKHLAHAHDLTNWTIDEVAPDRFLVRSNDLESWYAGLAADPNTIAKARHDFGDMILSWDTILSNPGPYTLTDPTIVGR